jgi:hypothetical protein
MIACIVSMPGRGEGFRNRPKFKFPGLSYFGRAVSGDVDCPALLGAVKSGLRHGGCGITHHQLASATPYLYFHLGRRKPLIRLEFFGSVIVDDILGDHNSTAHQVAQWRQSGSR